jgi:hypothetical protein
VKKKKKKFDEWLGKNTYIIAAQKLSLFFTKSGDKVSRFRTKFLHLKGLESRNQVQSENINQLLNISA